jgi:O-antigen/teichoic acid export membrane protein
MTHQLIKHGLYNAVAGVMRIIMSILTVPLLIRFLGLETYGLWAFVSALLGMAALAEGGLSSTTTIFVTRDLAKNDSTALSQTLSISFSFILGLATTTGLITYLSAPAIVAQFINLPEMQQQYAMHGLQLAGGVVWVRLIQQICEGIEQAYQNYRLMNILNTLQWIGISIGLLVIAWQGGTIPQLMQWLLCVGIMTLSSHIWVIIKLLKQHHLQYIWNHQKARKIAHQSWMTWGTTFGSALFTKGDRIIVGSQLGPAALGLYSAITDIASSLNLFSTLTVQPLMSTLSRSIAEKVELLNQAQAAQVKAQVQQAFRLNTTMIFGMGAMLYTFAPWLMQLFVGNTVEPQAVMFCQVIILIYTLFALNSVGYYILLSLSSVEWATGIYLGSGLFSLLLIKIGAVYAGLGGAIVGNASYLISCLIIWIALRKLDLKLSFWLKTVSFPLGWLALMIISNWIMPNYLGWKILISSMFLLCLVHWFIKASHISPKSLIFKLSG